MYSVATALTVYGIETCHDIHPNYEEDLLQQPLPFTVLKHDVIRAFSGFHHLLQQPLPFTVLKLQPL